MGGSLKYLAFSSCPTLFTPLMSQTIPPEYPRIEHWMAANHVEIFLASKMNFCIKGGMSVYFLWPWLGRWFIIEKRTIVVCIKLNSWNDCLSWTIHFQAWVELSTAVNEAIAYTTVVKELGNVSGVLSELGIIVSKLKFFNSIYQVVWLSSSC